LARRSPPEGLGAQTEGLEAAGHSRCPAHRRGTEHKEAAHLRSQRPEATGAGGRPAPACSQPIRVLWCSQASQKTLSASSKGFSTAWNSIGSSVNSKRSLNADCSNTNAVDIKREKADHSFCGCTQNIRPVRWLSLSAHLWSAAQYDLHGIQQSHRHLHKTGTCRHWHCPAFADRSELSDQVP
jgi:hypothetical protein